MRSSKEIEQEFLQELNNLFKKYGASIDLDVNGNACADMIVSINAVYDSEGETISPYIEIDLGGSYYP